MTKARIQVRGEKEFTEREWLRREVLWASLMTPYSAQMAGWFNGTAVHQHNSNISRATLYAEKKFDLDSQVMAFFNQGKNIASILSSATLFKSAIAEKPREDGEELTGHVLKTQTRVVDMAIGRTPSNSINLATDDLDAYRKCQLLVVHAEGATTEKQFARRQRLRRASRIMIGLAKEEIRKWRLEATQDPENSRPALEISNGGHPRSTGPRVEKLQPIFHQIVQSELYQRL